MSRFACWLAWAITLSTAVGCETLVNYPVDRAMDLADVAGINFYWGQGGLAHARATKIVQGGVGAFDGDIFKLGNRSYGLVEEMRSEAGLPLFYFTAYDRKPVPECSSALFVTENSNLEGLGKAHYNLTDKQDRGFYELGIDVALFAGVGFSIDFFQVLDFTLGWVGIDIAKDDARHSSRQRVKNPRYEGIKGTPVTGHTDVE
jgi:hypothetical protein